MMKLLVAFVHPEDVQKPAAEFVERHIHFTILDSTSGLLREPTKTLLIGIPEERLEECLEVLRRTCNERQVGAPATILSGLEVRPGEFDIRHRPITVRVGGAVGFVLDVDQIFGV
jgi:uncharacterized protein YaaQ